MVWYLNIFWTVNHVLVPSKPRIQQILKYSFNLGRGDSGFSLTSNRKTNFLKYKRKLLIFKACNNYYYINLYDLFKINKFLSMLMIQVKCYYYTVFY